VCEYPTWALDLLHGRVVYVGKANSLRSRHNSYFADLSGLAPPTRQMVTTAASVEWTVVNTEVEALQLEYKRPSREWCS
jgi:excinuclease ABC subunit C